MKISLRCLSAAFLVVEGTGLGQQPTFTKITQGAIVNDVGVQFVRGVWADFNNDGFLDVFVNDKGGVNVFYTNNGNGTFTKITQGPEVQGAGDHSLPSWVDYDNDGTFDLMVPVGFFATTPSQVQLFSNNGQGAFTRTSAGDLTGQSGYYGLGAWADYDNDGFVDFVVASLPATGSGSNFVFHNNGDGTFSKTSLGAVTTDRVTPAALIWVDYDNDGFIDLFVVNSSDSTNRLYHNNHDSTFTRELTNAIVTDRWVGAGQGNAAAWGDYDNDGLPDLFIAAGSGAQNRLYHNEGAGAFTKITSSPVLVHGPGVESWGCAWGDYDNDGYLDLFVSSYNGRNQFFHNNGDGTFTQNTNSAPANDGSAGIYYFAPSWVDYDNDGFLDLFVAGGSGGFGKNLLYHNNRNTNGWLEVKCVGTVSNRAAIGAKVRARATIAGKTFWQVREINEGGGHTSLPPVAHFGLGDATNIDLLRIEWPSGIVQTMTNVTPRQIVTIVEHQENGAVNFIGATQSNGIVTVSATGNPGPLYVLEASTNLTSWTKLSVRTNVSGTVVFSDPAAAKFSRRFYRVAVP